MFPAKNSKYKFICNESQTLQRHKSYVPDTSLYPIKYLGHNKLHLATRFGHHSTVNDTVSVTTEFPTYSRISPTKLLHESLPMVSSQLKCVLNVSMGSMNIQENKYSISIHWMVPKLIVLPPHCQQAHRSTTPFQHHLTHMYCITDTPEMQKLCSSHFCIPN
jgi:hypothetical protein